MGKYIGPKFKIIRRLGTLIGFLPRYKKTKLWTAGEHGKKQYFFTPRPSLTSDYKEKFLEKQKLRFNYGITEKQLFFYYKYAKKLKGSTEFNLFRLLEARLDSIVFRLGFAPTILAARQYINHKHICVNYQKVNIPSFLCKKNDIITIASKSSIKNLIYKNLNTIKIQADLLTEKYKTTNYIKKKISRKELKLNVNFLKIIEFYSR